VGVRFFSRSIPAVAKDLPESIRRILLDFPRQALHAASLGFRHPRTRAVLRFDTPPPADMASVIARLEADLASTDGPPAKSFGQLTG